MGLREHDLSHHPVPALTKPFMATQAAKGSRYSQLAYESYQLVAAEPFYDIWEVVTTCWLANQSSSSPPPR